ncbi:MAG: DUF11 domain-containing protein, partial [bacterium]|nr:DUF11 domain-containing protein [bacterium]
AALRFDFRTGTGVEVAEDLVVIEVSANGGTDYSVLETLDLGPSAAGSRTYDISRFSAVDTRIRLRISAAYGGPDEYFYADNVEIEKTTTPPPFYALSTIDYDDTTNDWGFSLTPEDFLATAAAVGWAPGSSDLTENGSPVWVTAEADTTLFVDYDGDSISDASFPLNRLESLRIRDADNDQTGMRIWTENGTRIAAAWGQEPGVASAGSPSLDLGTAVLPFVNPVLIKEGDLAIDRNGNGLVDPGDTLLYTLTLKNVAISQLVDPEVVDVPDPNTTYEPNTTELDGVPIADDAGPETPFPLDDDGYTLATMQPGETVVLTYQMTIADPLPAGVWSVENRATVTAGDGSTSAATPSTIAIPGIRVTKVSDAGGPVLPGQLLTYTVTVSNPSPLTADDVFVQDLLPTGTTYVPQSTVAIGPSGGGPVTKDNIPGGANPDLVDGSPPDLVLPTDDFDLAQLDTLTVTFQVQVVGSPDPNLTRILNVASASSPEIDVLVTDQVIDPLSPGGQIGDLVWLDVDGDGLRDLGEPGISNVTVELLNGVCTQGVNCPATVTDINGRYGFNRLVPGSYQVFLDETTLPGSPGELVSAPGTANPSAVLVITTTEVYEGLDFGYGPAPGTNAIGDYLWSDADNDGVQDPGEPGIGGVTLDLKRVFSGTTAATTTTAADGSYLFTGVGPGLYRVKVTDTAVVLAGYTLSSGPQSESDPTSPVWVWRDDVELSTDFGYFKASLFSIADVVWLDADDNGLRGPAEPGIQGVTVLLVDDLNGNGTRDSNEPVIASTVSDANGDVSFLGLEAGDYLVVLEDVDAVLVGMAGTTSPAQAFELAVQVGPDHSSESFGYTKPGAIGDRLWSDGNNDGLQDPGEPGLSGVTVELWLDDGDGVFDSTVDFFQSSTTTDAAGNYLFTELEVHRYFTSVDDTQAALTDTTPTTVDQEAGPNAAGTQIEAALLLSNASFLAADFGYQDTSLFDVSGNVFEDLDADGFDDGAGEPGLTGVTVELVDPGPDLAFGTADDLTVAVATSDAQGNYLFPDVQGSVAVPRDYRVEITDTAGVLTDYQLTSGLDSIEITVSDAEVSGIDFGYVRDAQTGSIGNSVWLDSDGDGLEGLSEAGLTSVMVDLYEDVDGDGVFEPGGDDGAPIRTTVTDADGRYLFTGLPAGDYFVDVVESTLPGSLAETTYPGVDPGAVIALNEGESFRQANFGYLPLTGTAVLGDRVWYDADPDGLGPLLPNGLQDPGEIGIAGVDVPIQGPGCAPCTVTTGPDGTWLATGLAAGAYMVTIDYASLPADVDTTPTNNGGDDVYNITVAEDDVFVHLDFGFGGGTFGTVGDLVWFDTDGDGVNAAEFGIEGVTVNLVRDTNADGVWDPDGVDNSLGTVDDESILATTSSDVLGAYSFSGVPLSDNGDGDASDADYLIDVTDIDGALAGLQRTAGVAGVDDNSQADPYALNLTAIGTSDLTADFGYTAVGEFGSIGSFVWRDLNGDGDVDAGEPGIGGVTIELWLDVDGDTVITPGIDNLVRGTTTDVNGEYQFSSLPYGDYLVDVTDDAAVLSGFSKTTGIAGTDNNSQADPCPMTLDAVGPDDMTADFGYEAAPGFIMTISGTVFEDGDNDGAFDDPGDPLVPGATVSLYRIVNGVRTLVDTVTSKTTGPDFGFYEFTDLPPGDYEIEVDVTGTLADGFIQTTQTGTGGIQPVTLTTSDSTGNNFGFWNGGITTTPVTLAYFEAGSDGSFRWMTSTEVGNLGFNLYALTDNGLERLNEELIASHVVDSLEPQSYEFESAGSAGEIFVLEDVDIHGVVRHHGPFYVDESAGSEAAKAQPGAWSEIRQKKAERRHAERSERAARRRAPARLSGAVPTPTLGVATGAFREGDGGCLGCDRGRRSRYPAASLGVEREGIYRVSYEDLLAAGIDLGGVQSSWLALSSRGVAVPMYMASGPLFGPGSYVEFVGEPVETLYTKTNIYRLEVHRQLAKRVEVAPFTGGGAPEGFYLETAKLENQSQYHFASPTGDPWYDVRLLAVSGAVESSIGFDLESWVPGAAPVALEVALWGGTDFPTAPDHHLLVEVNASQVAEEWFDGLAQPEIAFTVSDGSLASSANTLTLKLPHDTGAKYDLVNYDHLKITYPRAFVARSDALRFASEGSDFVVSGLSSAGAVAYGRHQNEITRLGVQVAGQPGAYEASFGGLGGGFGEPADYWLASGTGVLLPTIAAARELEPRRDPVDVVVVSHGDFLAGLDPWVAQREAEGLTVEVVDVADLYAHYSHGIVDPEAIRRHAAVASAKLGARYLLLVGGDTYDYFDYLGVGSMSFVPSLYAQTDAIVRFAPVDPLYGDVDGDLVPDLAVGRWPVRTTEELAAVIDKTLAYAPSSESLSAVMASDGEDLASGYSFTLDSQNMASLLGSDWQVDQVSLDELPVADARQALIDGIGAGPALTSYFGHSSLTVWSFDGLFGSADVEELTNTGAPTLVTQWGCWNTYHVLPTYETLGNRLLLEPDRGAAAVLGAATLTEALSERRLGQRVFERLTQPGLRLGDSITEAKQDLAETDPGRLDVLLGWTLLGDPTLTVVP